MPEQRYWKVRSDAKPGEPIAEHDASDGPGNYAVVVRRSGKTIAGGDVEGARSWPIELVTPRTLGVTRFNPGMARWFGLRLIEAAAIYESVGLDLPQEGSGAPATTTAAGTPESTGDPVSISHDLAVARLRDCARKLIDEQSAPAAMELRAALREAIAAGMMTTADFNLDVIGYFTPHEQTVIRGRVDF